MVPSLLFRNSPLNSTPIRGIFLPQRSSSCPLEGSLLVDVMERSLSASLSVLTTDSQNANSLATEGSDFRDLVASCIRQYMLQKQRLSKEEMIVTRYLL